MSELAPLLDGASSPALIALVLILLITREARGLSGELATIARQVGDCVKELAHTWHPELTVRLVDGDPLAPPAPHVGET